MTIDTIIMLVGAFIATLPFLGFPIRWDDVLMVIAGIIVIALGIIIRRRGAAQKVRTRATNSYVESAPAAQNDVHEAV